MPKKSKSHNQARKLKFQEKDDGPLYYKKENQDYALVIKKLGDMRIMCALSNGDEIMGIIPGKFRKKVWIDRGNIILISFRDFQTNKVDIIYKYSQKEARKLYKGEHIPKFFIDGEQVDNNINADNIEFDSDDEETELNAISLAFNDKNNDVNLEDL